MSFSGIAALPTLLESLATLPATSMVPLDCEDVDTLLDFRDTRDELRPVIRGGVFALCSLVEDIGPTGLESLQLQGDLLGTAWHELTAFDAWLEELLASSEEHDARWRDYRRELLTPGPHATSRLVCLLNNLASSEMDDVGRLSPSEGLPLAEHATAVRWSLLAPAASLQGTLLAAKPLHPRAITQHLPAIAAFVRECHAGMAWLDALPQRLTQGGQDVALSA